MKNNDKHDISTEVSDKETQQKVKSLQSSFMSGGISRRDFVATSMALGVSLAGATAIVNQAEAATPKQGGR